MAVSVMMATPLNSTPLFHDPERWWRRGWRWRWRRRWRRRRRMRRRRDCSLPRTETPERRTCSYFHLTSLQPERAFSGVSGPPGTKSPKKVSKRVLFGVFRNNAGRQPKKVKAYHLSWNYYGIILFLFSDARNCFSQRPKSPQITVQKPESNIL